MALDPAKAWNNIPIDRLVAVVEAHVKVMADNGASLDESMLKIWQNHVIPARRISESDGWWRRGSGRTQA